MSPVSDGIVIAVLRRCLRCSCRSAFRLPWALTWKWNVRLASGGKKRKNVSGVREYTAYHRMFPSHYRHPFCGCDYYERPSNGRRCTTTSLLPSSARILHWWHRGRKAVVWRALHFSKSLKLPSAGVQAEYDARKMAGACSGRSWGCLVDRSCLGSSGCTPRWLRPRERRLAWSCGSWLERARMSRLTLIAR